MTNSMNPSPEYKAALKQAKVHHSHSKTYSGRLLRPHTGFLVDLVQRLDISSALDYGCGKGAQYDWVDPSDQRTIEQKLGFEVTKFDPAWPPFSDEPQGQFDLVICSHVLGGIPSIDLPWVIDRLYGLATKAVFIAEKIGAIKKSVHGDGRISRNSMEWIDAIAPHRREGIETHLSVIYRTQNGKFNGRFRL